MSAFGTKRTSRHAQAMSAFGGKADIGSNINYQNGFQVGVSVNLSQPRFAPSRRPIPERIGTTTILFPVSAVMPKPPTRYTDPLMPPRRLKIAPVCGKL